MGQKQAETEGGLQRLATDCLLQRIALTPSQGHVLVISNRTVMYIFQLTTQVLDLAGNLRIAKVFAILVLSSALPLQLVEKNATAETADWPTLGFVQVTTNAVSGPTSITHAGDGSQRLFVTERVGRIRILQGSNVLAQPFLDITSKVGSTGSEQGLLSVAFPPGYASKRYFYVDYIRKTDGAIVVSRFQVTADNNLADTNSEQVITTIPKLYSFHNGGQIAFGPDGYLYVGVGDGGPQGDTFLNAQQTTTVLGKILRIDVENGVTPYAIPPSNPFVGNTNYLPEIWATGVRNPWRFSFDRLTGDFYLGDVGQYRYEEIDFQPEGNTGGQNYGWRIKEGPTNYVVPTGFTNFAGLTEPVAWYDHFALPTYPAGSVTGGYVYRGPSEPRMDGVYLYGDFTCGWIWGLKKDGTSWENYPLLQTGYTSHFWISTFGEDEQGQIYMADFNVGKIYQIQDTRQVWTPVFTPTNGFVYSNSVVVSCATTNATICYTTNGAAPTLADPTVPGNGILSVGNGITNKVRAFRADLAPSGVATGVFTYRVGTPYSTPPPGPITNATVVVIATVTPGANIYFTTNGMTPTTNSVLYAGPLTLNGPVTLRTLGVAAGFSNSAVATAFYSAAQVATPSFLPASGPITNGTTITITNTTPGTTIHYAVDGSTPTASSPVYSGPFAINGGTTVGAIGVADGYVNSSARNVFYQLVQTAMPVFNPASGLFTNGTPITITCATPESTIYYTNDGSTPTTNSAIYVVPVLVEGATTLSAFALTDGHLPSAVRATFYSLSDYKYPCVVTTIAGNGTAGLVDGVGAMARFSSPKGICIDDAGNLHVADSGNNRIRTITPSNNVSTIASILTPIGICADRDGNLFVAENSSYRIRKIDPQGNVTTFAGSGTWGYQDGPSLSAQFKDLRYLEWGPQTNLYAGDWARVRTIAIDGTVGTLAGNGANSSTGLGGDVGLGVSLSNTVYAASVWGRVFEIPSSGALALFAGSLSGYSDGPKSVALFAQESASYWDARDVAVSEMGEIYVSDYSQVRRIDIDGWVSTLAGSTTLGFRNGDGRSAQFNHETGLCTDTNGNVYVADTGNHAIRKISPDTAAIGIADDWQRTHFGYVGIEPNSDPDHDGLSSFAEFWAGTDPMDFNSSLSIDVAALLRGGQIQIRWQSVAGKTYAVQHSSNLVTWNTLGSPVIGDGSSPIVIDPDPIGQDQRRYYRVALTAF